MTYRLCFGKDLFTLGESVGGCFGGAGKTGRRSSKRHLAGSKGRGANSEQSGNSNSELHGFKGSTDEQ